MHKKQKLYNLLILAMSILAVIGFMYFGWYWDPILNIQNGNLFPTTWWFEPCNICIVWRIFTAIIILLTLCMWVFRRYNPTLFLSIFFVSMLGVVMQTYQYYLQMGVNGWDSAFCDPATPCGKIDLMYAGFITIPLMAWVYFAIIAILARYGFQSRKYIISQGD